MLAKPADVPSIGEADGGDQIGRDGAPICGHVRQDRGQVGKLELIHHRNCATR
jgi:hypothetical protein